MSSLTSFRTKMFEAFRKRMYAYIGISLFVFFVFFCQLVNLTFIRGEEFRAKADEYKSASTYPDRYSYYWVTVVHGASDIVALFNFTHVNRRHALSPDGWAAMMNKRTFDVQSYDLHDRLAT